MHLRHFLFILFIFPILFTSCNTQSTIANSIPEREANEIVVLLNSKGIQAQKVPAPVSSIGGGTQEKMWNIDVPANQITDALSILNQTGLPRIKGTTLLDLFGAKGLVPSDMQDKIRYQEGLSAQLAITIRKMDGIIDANVQITFPEENEEAKEVTASIYVKHRGILDNPNSLAITKIKRLIASAVPGLSSENVSVITDRAIYADINLQGLDEMDHEREYVSVWSVEVSKNTVNRFRWIFYICIVLIFLLACALAWMFWKCMPLIQSKGGFNSLFKPQQYTSETEEKIEEEQPPEESPEE
ncbi:MAG: hypothetical protein S4CHLAM123_02950 [Chlamydiales bacterium]|nr:hypothetical protein [Chlamydiales bacterium]